MRMRQITVSSSKRLRSSSGEIHQQSSLAESPSTQPQSNKTVSYKLIMPPNAKKTLRTGKPMTFVVLDGVVALYVWEGDNADTTKKEHILQRNAHIDICAGLNWELHNVSGQYGTAEVLLVTAE